MVPAASQNPGCRIEIRVDEKILLMRTDALIGDDRVTGQPNQQNMFTVDLDVGQLSLPRILQCTDIDPGVYCFHSS